VLYAILMLVTDRRMDGCACFSQYVIERWSKIGRLTSQDAGCRQIRDTPYRPELHDGYAGKLSRIGSGNRDLVDIKVL
jgi:hypothetical protein